MLYNVSEYRYYTKKSTAKIRELLGGKIQIKISFRAHFSLKIYVYLSRLQLMDRRLYISYFYTHHLSGDLKEFLNPKNSVLSNTF